MTSSFYVKYNYKAANKQNIITFVVVLKNCITSCIVTVSRLPTNYANKRTKCRTYFTLCFTSSFLHPFSPFFLSLLLSFPHHKLLKQLSFIQALTFALFSSIPIFFSYPLIWVHFFWFQKFLFITRGSERKESCNSFLFHYKDATLRLE